ncbi:hypothetical protein BBP40_007244 [Aspergillus hancockii]|nr:hypothetical protein BBP40_007244 [Aspergillus hancockii]
MSFIVFVQSLLAAIFNIVGPGPSAVGEPRGGARGRRKRGSGAGLLPPGSPELEGLLLAYSKSLNTVFYLLVAAAVVCFAAAWGMGWVDIRKKAPEENRA